MKETSFIKQNIDKWNAYEEELGKKKKDPKTLSKLFIQITDDLAYAQTFYKNRSVRVYLNGIAQLLFNDINKRNRFKFRSIIEFWTKDLPVILFKTRFELLFSFIVFALMMGIGVVTSIYKPDFAASILGQSYVDMTMENIANNDPMAVYKKQHGMDMFLGITLNNLVVAFRTFIFGIFFGLGTFFSLIRNGIMVGTFQYFFIERGLFQESFLTIWQHGALEISAIIIAGAAGFTIGRGLILPGAYTRLQSLRITARRGLKIMIGLVPVFVMAAFIEGFFTRHTEVNDVVRLISIILSFSFVLFYFVIYPRRAAKKYPEKLDIVDKLNESESSLPDTKSILSHEMLFGATLNVIKRGFLQISKQVLILSALAALVITFGFRYFFPEIDGALLERGQIFGFFVDFKESPLLLFFSILFYSVVILYSLQVYLKQFDEVKIAFFERIKKRPIVIANALFSSLILLVPFYLPIGWAIFISVFNIPFILLANFTSYQQNKFLFTGIGKSFGLLKRTSGKFLFLNLKFMLISLIILLLGNPELYSQLLSFLHWNLWFEDQVVTMILNFIACFMYFICILLSFQLIMNANNVLYHTLYETHFCSGLIARVEKIGLKNTLRGYELE